MNSYDIKAMKELLSWLIDRNYNFIKRGNNIQIDFGKSFILIEFTPFHRMQVDYYLPDGSMRDEGEYLLGEVGSAISLIEYCNGGEM